MKITIIATGSRGDVQPYVALGKGLLERGETVRFVTFRNFAALVEAHGLAFHPVEGNVQEIVESQVMRERVEGGSFIRLMAQMAREAERGALALTAAGLAASRGADLLLGGLGGVFTGAAVAEKLNLPLVQAYYVPLTPTRAFPSVLAPNLPGWLHPLNPDSHRLTRQIMWQGFRAADTAARRRLLDLPAAPFFGPYRSPCTREMPILYGYSPAVIARPPDWGPQNHVTGYWFLDAEQAWSPPPGLVDFLQSGPPPVYIGFGSMSSRCPAHTARLILEALRLSGQRAILASGWSGIQPADLPASVYLLDSAPHDWLFPRVAAVVHHGGAGTTAAGFRAGVPSVIIPFFGDQPFWGRRAADLGVGPRPIPRKALTPERLADAIRQAVEDTGMRARAARLGEEIRKEDGVARAVEVIRAIR